ncbi:hypothetical protein EXN66_Car011037 [Channa argus]|uniref:Uncharacterized protein n=1 Tax=Channa argus TaxID=215402 RepID=A0A6G1PYE7_CHAAH|nr:hypothetical protein EXN66_Car011037 [Channa argus]
MIVALYILCGESAFARTLLTTLSSPAPAVSLFNETRSGDMLYKHTSRSRMLESF